MGDRYRSQCQVAYARYVACQGTLDHNHEAGNPVTEHNHQAAGAQSDGLVHRHDANGTVADFGAHKHATTDKTLSDHEHAETTTEPTVANPHSHGSNGSVVDDGDVTTDAAQDAYAQRRERKECRLQT